MGDDYDFYEINDASSYNADEDNYYVEDLWSAGASKILDGPPDVSDDYYDPGPPSSYYDDYYDEAEDRMSVAGATPAPSILSPTQLKLKQLTRSLRKAKQARKKKKEKTGKVSKDRRPKRSAENVYNVDSVHSNLDPNLYEVQVYNDFEDSQDIEFIPYPFPEHSEDLDYDYYDGNEFDVVEFVKDFSTDNIDKDSPGPLTIVHGFKNYKKTEKQEDPPVVSRSWVDNMIMFRDKLFGKTAEKEVEDEPGEPQVKIHYPNYSEKPYVSISEARKAQAVLNKKKNPQKLRKFKDLSSTKTKNHKIKFSDVFSTKSPPAISFEAKKGSLAKIPQPLKKLNGLPERLGADTTVFTPEEIEKYGIKLKSLIYKDPADINNNKKANLVARQKIPPTEASNTIDPPNMSKPAVIIPDEDDYTETVTNPLPTQGPYEYYTSFPTPEYPILSANQYPSNSIHPTVKYSETYLSHEHNEYPTTEHYLTHPTASTSYSTPSTPPKIHGPNFLPKNYNSHAGYSDKSNYNYYSVLTPNYLPKKPLKSKISSRSTTLDPNQPPMPHNFLEHRMAIQLEKPYTHEALARNDEVSEMNTESNVPTSYIQSQGSAYSHLLTKYSSTANRPSNLKAYSPAASLYSSSSTPTTTAAYEDLAQDHLHNSDRSSFNPHHLGKHRTKCFIMTIFLDEIIDSMVIKKCFQLNFFVQIII